MTRRTIVAALTLLAIGGCDETVYCPGAGIPDQFAIVLDRDEWRPAQYRIELTYEAERGKRTDTCSVQVPFVELVETDDGGLDVELIAEGGASDAGDAGDAGDAAARSSDEQPCASSRPNRRGVVVNIGRAIVLRGIGHPSEVQLVVREGEEVVLERDLDLRYVTSYPTGRDCGPVETSQLRVTLP